VLDVELAYDAREFRLSVRDNGKGMDHDTRQHGRPGHWGLTGMRERAQQIGARFSIASPAGGGVEVALTIKAPQAYATS
jgi:signal transduction histidine kinase